MKLLAAPLSAIRQVCLLVLCAATAARADDARPPLSYNFEVRPLLASKCFACHGMDAARRKGKLRLDQRESALEKKAIVPGKPSESELIKRINTDNEEDVMPPPEKHNPLDQAEKDLLTRWIAEGAQYEQHWSFTTPMKPPVPAIQGTASPIDALVRATLDKKGWKPAAEADRSDWLRRITFALTGLPPTPDEIAAFLADQGPDAFATVVDRLLRSPRYGERMAVIWCDAARYADTYGRHEDADSFVWPWRDWVIRAFNDNLPYDKFLQWQIAGDLMPNPTQDQIIATAFNRLTVQSNESGSDPEEFRWDQVFDRVKTVGSAVLGVAIECARCHDHKFDPLTRTDYYRFAAFFDKIDELGLFSRYTNGIPAPSAFVYKPGQQAKHEQLKQAVIQAEAEWRNTCDGARPRFEEWLHDHAPPTRGGGLWAELSGQPNHERMQASMQPPHLYMSFDLINMNSRFYIADSNYDVESSGIASVKEDFPGVVGKSLSFPAEKPHKFAMPARMAPYLRWQPFTVSIWMKMAKLQDHAVILHRSRAGLDAANRGYELTLEDGRLTATLAYFYPGNAIRIQADERIEFDRFRHIAVTYDGSSRAGGLSIYVDGHKIRTQIVRDHLTNDISYLQRWGDLNNVKVADADESKAIALTIGGRTLDAGLRDTFVDELRVYSEQLTAVEIALLAGAAVEADDASWRGWFMREIDGACRIAFDRLTAARKAESEFAVGLDHMMVMDESHGPKRQTTMLNRGDFRQRGDPVEPGTPAALLPFPDGAPRNRLGLAQWLTDPRNPLTARVQVNRIWAMLFGHGLEITAEDFGLQGRVPAHPAVLDYLAVHFMETGWDMKALIREIALTQTYRQSTRPSDPKLFEADPDNQFLARGPRFRLPAEQLRDAALSACGLLNPAIGGPSVMPYQPAGLWEESGTQHIYNQDHGDKLYRRSLYTFWRRTCPPPTMNVFDAPTREFCRVRRDVTLTPLQALALMNDTGFLEAARVMAQNLVRKLPQPAQDAARVTEACRLLYGREPSPAQSKALVAIIQDAREYYSANPADARKFIMTAGESPREKTLPNAEVASTMLMARALLNSEPFVESY